MIRAASLGLHRLLAEMAGEEPAEVWEAACARGLLPAGWVDEEHARGFLAPADAAGRRGVRPWPPTPHALAVVASDVRVVLAAELLAREAVARVARWLPEPPADRILWDVAVEAASGPDPRWGRATVAPYGWPAQAFRVLAEGEFAAAVAATPGASFTDVVPWPRALRAWLRVWTRAWPGPTEANPYRPLAAMAAIGYVLDALEPRGLVVAPLAP